jgi:tripartite-type tricarboxylate transporter receptor subunit TctC
VAALGSPAVAARFEELGIAAVGNSPEEFGRFVAAEGARWGEVARRANIRLD